MFFAIGRCLLDDYQESTRIGYVQYCRIAIACLSAIMILAVDLGACLSHGLTRVNDGELALRADIIELAIQNSPTAQQLEIPTTGTRCQVSSGAWS